MKRNRHEQYENLKDQYIVNIDASNKCMLKCPKCLRQKRPDMDFGDDIPLERFEILCKSFNRILLCGDYSDPIYHPQFHELIKIAINHNCAIDLYTNGFGRKEKWWDDLIDIIKDYKNIFFTIAMDGIPGNNNTYRVNQDGYQVMTVMKKLRSKGIPVTWSFIPFSYNEDDIDEAKRMAKDNDINLILMISSRWDGPNDPLMPKNKELRIYNE